MTERVNCEVHLMINEDGEYVVSNDVDDLGELYEDRIGGVPQNCRTYALTLSVPLPTSVAASAIIPDVARRGEALAVAIEA